MLVDSSMYGSYTLDCSLNSNFAKNSAWERRRRRKETTRIETFGEGTTFPEITLMGTWQNFMSFLSHFDYRVLRVSKTNFESRGFFPDIILMG